MKKFADNLKFLRVKNNLTQADMLSEIGIKRSTWNNYEAKTSKPNISVLIKIAKYFAFTETELLHYDLSKLKPLSKKSTYSRKNI
jgi:transcriptional regulator with XRE-family HTH domain